MKNIQLNITIVFLILCIIAPTHTKSQVTIGSTLAPNPGSLLDLKNNGSEGENAYKGLGLPRVALIDRATLTIAAMSEKDKYIGAIVYNTTETSTFCKGAYSWQGGEWLQISGIKEPALTTLDSEANSFILKPRAHVRIPVKKAYDAWLASSYLDNQDLKSIVGTRSAKLVWEDSKGLIDHSTPIKLVGNDENAYIEVKLSFTCGEALTGNALVAFTIDNQIYWSWHLWVVEYNPNEDVAVPYYGAAAVEGGYVFGADNGAVGGNYVFMDRYLGATSLNYKDGIKTYGMLYQWGRKDPFPSSGEVKKDVDPDWYDAIGAAKKVTYATVATPNNVKNAFHNPYTYYTHTYKHWATTSNTGYNDLWQNAVKTDFDPCPKGWRVTHSINGKSAWNYILASGYNTASYAPADSDVMIGRRDDTGELFVIKGYRTFDGKHFGTYIPGNRSWGFIWDSESRTATDQQARGMLFHSGQVWPESYQGKSTGGNVRCVKE